MLASFQNACPSVPFISDGQVRMLISCIAVFRVYSDIWKRSSGVGAKRSLENQTFIFCCFERSPNSSLLVISWFFPFGVPCAVVQSLRVACNIVNLAPWEVFEQVPVCRKGKVAVVVPVCRREFWSLAGQGLFIPRFRVVLNGVNAQPPVPKQRRGHVHPSSVFEVCLGCVEWSNDRSKSHAMH